MTGRTPTADEQDSEEDVQQDVSAATSVKTDDMSDTSLTGSDAGAAPSLRQRTLDADAVPPEDRKPSAAPDFQKGGKKDS